MNSEQRGEFEVIVLSYMQIDPNTGDASMQERVWVFAERKDADRKFADLQRQWKIESNPMYQRLFGLRMFSKVEEGDPDAPTQDVDQALGRLFAQPDTIRRNELHPAKLKSRFGDTVPTVIDGGKIKQFSEYGWMEKGAAKPSDYDLYPEVIG
jgi:hypothetical protein